MGLILSNWHESGYHLKSDFCTKGPILGFFDAFPELWCLLIILGVLGLSITCEQEHYAEAKTL